MKKTTITTVFLALSTIIYTPLIWAQGLDVDIDLADDTPNIFENPQFWIGVAVVAVIVAFILRGRNK